MKARHSLFSRKEKIKMDEEYKSNSNKSKQKDSPPDAKPIVSVAKGKIIEKTPARKAADNFFAEDMKGVGSYVVKDVLLPGIKRILSTAIKGAVDTAFYGTGARFDDMRGPRRPGQMVDYTQRNYFDGRDQAYQNGPMVRTHSMSTDNILFESYGEAQDVVHGLQQLISQYGVASVAQMYDLAGVSIMGDYTKHNYGWNSITSQNTRIIDTRDGYILDMPKALPLE